MSYADINFEAPVRTDLESVGRHYYTQAVKHHNADFCLVTDWFESHGVKEAFDKKLEMTVQFTKDNLDLLKNLEDMAIKSGLKLPAEFQSSVPVEQIFKRLPLNKPRLFVKLNHDAVLFDKLCSPMQLSMNMFGDYRVIVHVKGLYIGPHQNNKLASLQLRISQLQFVPKKPQCMFNLVSGLTFANAPGATIPVTANIQNPEITPESAVPAQAKKGRKPKLQRQNAMNENVQRMSVSNESQVQQLDQHRMQSLSEEFFNDFGQIAGSANN